VDLEHEELRTPDGAIHRFTLDGFFRELLLKGLDEIGMTLDLLPEIERFERAYAAEAF